MEHASTLCGHKPITSYEHTRAIGLAPTNQKDAPLSTAPLRAIRRDSGQSPVICSLLAGHESDRGCVVWRRHSSSTTERTEPVDLGAKSKTWPTPILECAIVLDTAKAKPSVAAETRPALTASARDGRVETRSGRKKSLRRGSNKRKDGRILGWHRAIRERRT